MDTRERPQHTQCIWTQTQKRNLELGTTFVLIWGELKSIPIKMAALGQGKEEAG